MAIIPLIDTNVIKENIGSFIQAVCNQTVQGQPVTWGYDWQQATRPLKPYAVYKITGPRKVGGIDEIRAVQVVDNEGNLVFDNEGNPVFNNYYKIGEREYTVSIECGSNNELATDLATNLMAALEQPQYVSILENGGNSVRGIQACQDVTALLADSTKFERRVILEFYLIAPSVAVYLPGVITQAQIEAELVNNAGDVLQTTLDVS